MENSVILYIISPCYNEEAVLPMTSKSFLNTLLEMINSGSISDESRILYVNDGSKDRTWDIICELAKEDYHFMGIAQSRNRGHQNAVWAGLMEAKDRCDITISIDCDGQDDIRAIYDMVKEYKAGSDVVWGVRNDRTSDSFFKRTTAQGFYKLMNLLGVETIYNHADYRLLSARVIKELEKFDEVNLFLRGMIPLVGFRSTSVYYKRNERLAGESHYPLKKMIALAIEGVTSLSVKPLHLIMSLGMCIAIISFIGVIWSVVGAVSGQTVAGWASMTSIICFIGGVQLMCLGVIGEYIGKIYMETKHRPKYIISDRTDDLERNGKNDDTQSHKYSK